MFKIRRDKILGPMQINKHVLAYLVNIITFDDVVEQCVKVVEQFNNLKAYNKN